MRQGANKKQAREKKARPASLCRLAGRASPAGVFQKAGALVVRPPESRCIQFWLFLTPSVTSAVSFSSCSAVGL